jgi:hypothetical protein
MALWTWLREKLTGETSADTGEAPHAHDPFVGRGSADESGYEETTGAEVRADEDRDGGR